MTTLVESTNALIHRFTNQALHASQLRNDLLARAEAGADGGDATALARSTTESMTSYTNLSDGTSYAVDPATLNSDLDAYTRHLTQIKYMWLESNIKRSYLERVLGLTEDGQAPVTQADCERAEVERTAAKASLKQKKLQAEEARREMAEVSRRLDNDLNKHLSPALDEARELTRSIQDMELELAMLRNSRPEDQRMTIEECNETLDQQIIDLQSLGEQLEQAKSQRAKQNAACMTAQKEVEKLAAERARMEKLEAEARGAVRNKDKRIEENCRQLVARTALLSSLLGIKGVHTDPDGGLKIVYDLDGGRSATLAIHTQAGQGRFKGASLLDSNINIEDIVTRCRSNNDIQQLVQEVLTRVK